MDIAGTIRRYPGRAALVAAFAAAALGFGLWWFTPWRLFTDDPVNQALPGARPVQESGGEPAPAGAPVTTASGRFIGLEHDTSGRALILETADGGRFLRFEGFETSNGPDLVVYLSAKPATPGDWYGYDGDFVDLGALKGNVGSQNYELPPDVDLGRYATAVVWCRRFEVGFAAATLS
jgi:electron transfer DM13